MAGQITYTVNEGVVSSSGNPLSASRILVGSVLQTVNENLAAGGSLVLQSNSWTAPGTASGNLVALYLLCNQPMTIQTNGNGTIGVQDITVSGGATGGTLALGYQGQITAPIAWDAAASAVQTALRALSTIGGTLVTCTGGPLGSAPVVCTFSGSIVLATVPLITSNIAGLTGGTPVITIANGSGTPQDVVQLSGAIDLSWDSECGAGCPFLDGVTALYLTNTNACNFRAMILTY